MGELSHKAGVFASYGHCLSSGTGIQLKEQKVIYLIYAY